VVHLCNISDLGANGRECLFHRYQRVSSPDCVPLSSGKKSNINGRILHTTTNIPGARTNVNGTGCSTLEGKGFRFRSPSITHDHNNLEAAPASPHSENHHHDSPPPPAKNHRHDRSPSPSASASPSPSRGGGGGGGGSGDMLLQWGQRKRARVSRSEIRALTDDSSSSSSSVAIKAQRRLAPAASTMPPPPHRLLHCPLLALILLLPMPPPDPEGKLLPFFLTGINQPSLASPHPLFFFSLPNISYLMCIYNNIIRLLLLIFRPFYVSDAIFVVICF
jgi:hypothetical protein